MWIGTLDGYLMLYHVVPYDDDKIASAVTSVTNIPLTPQLPQPHELNHCQPPPPVEAEPARLAVANGGSGCKYPAGRRSVFNFKNID